MPERSPYAEIVKSGDLAFVAGVRADLAAGRARAARAALGIQQGEMATALGVAASTVSQWEAGKRTPGTAHALAYGKLLRDLARRAAA